MEAKGFFSNRVVRTALAGSLGFLLACGEASGQTSSPDPEGGGSEPTVVAEYYQNGNRILRYEDDGDAFADVLQICDGQDLLEQTEFLKVGYGAGGNSVERSVGHTACTDGRLTADDFASQG